MTKLRILHISDLHERAAFAGMSPSRIARIGLDAEERGRLLGRSFTEALQQAAANVDLVCFTGDVADWGHPAEYAAARQRVLEILDIVGLSADRFYAVPGNHDVQRGLHHSAWKVLRDWHASSHDTARLGRWLRDASDAPFGMEPATRDLVLQRAGAFWDWMDSLGRGVLRPAPPKHLGYRNTLGTGAISGLNFPVHVIGLDSAWMCGGDDDQGKIVLTEEQAQGHLFDRGALLPGLRIVLVHHPLEHLADYHDIRRVMGDAGVDLVLHGHQHTPTSFLGDEHGNRVRTLAAGCLVEGELGKRWPNGFQVIELDFQESVGRIEFRKWSREGRFWAKGCDIYQDAPDGVLEWKLERPLHPATSTEGNADAPDAPFRLAVAPIVRGPCVLDPALVISILSRPAGDSAVRDIMLACADHREVLFELAIGSSEYVGKMRTIAARSATARRFQHLQKDSIDNVLDALRAERRQQLARAVEVAGSTAEAVVAMATSVRPPREQLAYVARLFALADGLQADLVVPTSRAVLASVFARILGGWSSSRDYGAAFALYRD